MTEQEHIERLNSELDHLVTRDTSSGLVSDDEADLLRLAQRLIETDFSTESQSLPVMRQALVEKMINRPQGRLSMTRQKIMLRTLSAAAAIGLVIIAFLTIPPLQSLAQTMLRQIGVLQFTNETTIPEQLAGQEASRQTDGAVYRPRTLDIETVQQQWGEAVYRLDDIPVGYTLSSRDILQSERGQQISTEYFHISPDRELPDILRLTQWQLAETTDENFSWAIGEAEPVEVLVNGVPGLYVDAAPTAHTVDAENVNQVLGVNILAWEQNGYLFYLQSFFLGLDALQQIAESLAPST